MTGPERPSHAQIQEYIDGRLGGRELAVVRSYLLDHPEIASEVETLRRQNEALRRLGQEVLDEPVPERLRQIVRRPARGGSNGAEPNCARRFLTVVTAFLLIWAAAPLGGFAGAPDGPDLGLRNQPSPTAACARGAGERAL